MAPALRRARRAISLLSIAVWLSACTITLGERPSSVLSPSKTAPPAAATVQARGRLAIVQGDGTLYTMRPDGSDRVELIAAGDRTLAAVQPAWSPDGRRLAWVVSDPAAGPGVGGIAVSGPRGEDPVVSATPFVPYYLSWDPTGSRVAFLGSAGDPDFPVEMGVLEVGPEATDPQPVAGGSPFLYFAWAPDGTSVLAHAGYERLEEITLKGRSVSVNPRPGLFATPAWSADGRKLVYVERGPGEIQRLVVQVGDKKPRTLVEDRGAVSFVLRPDGEAVAYQVLGPGEIDFFDRRPPEAEDGVRIVDLRTGDTRRVTRIRAMTYWWSPDGERLLTLAPEPQAEGTIPFRWQVWDGRTTSDVQGQHSPTLSVLRDYAPFFTQYAQSTTPWAPEGSAFAFAAETDDGAGRIFVQEVDGEPIVVGEGVYVTWSPAAA
jgi:Tol biopolymer transport system component